MPLDSTGYHDDHGDEAVIERMAEAFYAATALRHPVRGALPWDRTFDFTRERWRIGARAAYAALRAL